jgi:plastocyanin
MKRAVLAAGVLAIAVVPAVVARGANSVPVVKTPGGVSFVVNQFIKDAVHFSPGHLSVPSGQTVTFKHTTKEDEPHTITVSTAADLPKKVADLERCKPCQIASKHLKNPKDDSSPIIHLVLNQGPAGLDEEGDSIALKPKKSATVVISAPPGTALHFMCAVHPWMQGTITVT